MAPQIELSKIGYEIEKFFGRQKSFSKPNPPPAATQNLCQYKFYPNYGATITTVVHTTIEDLTCRKENRVAG